MMTSSRSFVIVALGTALMLTSCLSDGRTMQPPTQEQVAAFTSATTSPDAIDEGSGDQSTAMSVTGPWVNGTAIDARYTCDGLGVSPPLAWTSGPEGTQAYGIVLRDNATPEVIQWVVANINSDTSFIREGTLPENASLVLNSSGKSSYAAPCPTVGSSHSYTVMVYALSSLLTVAPTANATSVIADMDASALEVATTDFLYSR